MATNKQEFEAIIKLVEKLNKELIKIGENASKSFEGLSD